MSELDYNQQATDVEYLTATVDFAYQIYEIESKGITFNGSRKCKFV